jgi:4'-phosphopantetheinyl transferase
LEERQLAHVCGWVLVRLALSSYVAAPPEAWAFVRERGGRPEVVGPSGARRLRFNVSHTAGMVACAVTWDRAVGVDVENASRPAPLEIADRFFSLEEAAGMHELSLPLRSRHFFRLWTLKEAYTKARGLGLSLPLDTFTVAIDAGSAARLRVEEKENDGSGWQLFAFEPTPLHHGAVAVRSEADPLDLRIIAVE